ncbi:hypothetical protein [Gryllotalpicola koreensis]|uniref:Uncharacterized protein n=1 Tax=Gryllotalpicola koreensis TaxID=993086 RepID=A0ABP7ZX89_9MICO
MRIGPAITTLLLGLLVLGVTYAEGYGEGVWLDENAPGAGSPSIIPLLLLGLAGLALVACGTVWVIIAATRAPQTELHR